MLRRWPTFRPGSQRQGGQAGSLPDDSGWFLLVVLFLLLLYWLLAHALERVDLSAWLASWLPVTLPQAVVSVIELFHPRVLRHFIPVLVGWWLAYTAAVNLVRVLYNLQDQPAAQRFLSRLLSGGASAGGPVLLDGRTLAAERENSVLLRVGGPGLVTVKNGNVAITELNGRFSRILGPGVHNLGRLEYVRAILDLRQQERSAEDVAAMTKDGIGVQAAITVTFRLSSGGETPTRGQPFPYDEEAVRTAAYAETVSDDGKVSTWDQLPLGRARGILAGIVAKYRLDEILFPDAPASEPYYTIRQELTRKLRAALADLGIELTGVHVGRLELPEPVSHQYLEYWQAQWKTQIQLSRANGIASAVEEKERARAEAEVTMIQAIIEGVRRAQYSGSPAAMREIIALRLIEALEKMARQSEDLNPLPDTLLPQLTDFHRQLLPENIPPKPKESPEQ